MHVTRVSVLRVRLVTQKIVLGACRGSLSLGVRQDCSGKAFETLQRACQKCSQTEALRDKRWRGEKGQNPQPCQIPKLAQTHKRHIRSRSKQLAKLKTLSFLARVHPKLPRLQLNTPYRFGNGGTGMQGLGCRVAFGHFAFVLQVQD